MATVLVGVSALWLSSRISRGAAAHATGPLIDAATGTIDVMTSQAQSLAAAASGGIAGQAEAAGQKVAEDAGGRKEM